jgi:hypothetical protein
MKYSGIWRDSNAVIMIMMIMMMLMFCLPGEDQF